jgi:hypothetical protein
VEDFVDCLAPAHGIDLCEHVMKNAKQQIRYGIGHGFPGLAPSQYSELPAD